MHHGHREGTRVQHRCSKRFGEGNRLGADGAPSPRGELGATGEVEIPRRGTRGTGAPRTWLLWAKLVNQALPVRDRAPPSPNGGRAAKYADQGPFTKESTAIKSMRSERERYTSMGQPTADVAGTGFATRAQQSTSCGSWHRRAPCTRLGPGAAPSAHGEELGSTGR
jgi:hypothetical protein